MIGFAASRPEPRTPAAGRFHSDRRFSPWPILVGAPEEVYDRQRTRFVADFVGSSNILPADMAGPLLCERRQASLHPSPIALVAEFVAGTEPDLTARIRIEALARGLVLFTCRVHGTVIRFLPPLTIPDDHFAEAMDILEEAVKAARGS